MQGIKTIKNIFNTFVYNWLFKLDSLFISMVVLNYFLHIISRITSESTNLELAKGMFPSLAKKVITKN